MSQLSYWGFCEKAYQLKVVGKVSFENSSASGLHFFFLITFASEDHLTSTKKKKKKDAFLKILCLMSLVWA